MSEIDVVRYGENYKEKWDKFVLTNSVNGCFLQSRIFLEYHKDRFVDHSLLFLRGGNIIAVCPACEITEDGNKKFYSHMGSTFGGIILGKEYYGITNAMGCVDALDEYLQNNGFKYALIKCQNEIFSSENCNIIDYMFYRKGYQNYDELSFAVDFAKVKDGDIVMNFKSKTRNLYRTSLKNNLEMKELHSKEEIADFYKILCKSLEKYETKPVHSLEELYELYFDRLPDKIRFYGIYQNGYQVYVHNSGWSSYSIPGWTDNGNNPYASGENLWNSINDTEGYFDLNITNDLATMYKDGCGIQVYNITLNYIVIVR